MPKESLRSHSPTVVFHESILIAHSGDSKNIAFQKFPVVTILIPGLLRLWGDAGKDKPKHAIDRVTEPRECRLWAKAWQSPITTEGLRLFCRDSDSSG